jgi:hypothetical protein
MIMLGRVVEYLRSSAVPFRLVSYPSPEPEPPVAHLARPEHGVLVVEARVLLVDGRVALGVVPRGEAIDVLSVRANLGATIVEEGALSDLPEPFGDASPPVPPLAGLFGAALFVDENVAGASLISFAAFGATDFVDMLYDDFARIEQPRLMQLARAGELPPATVH